MTDTAAAADPTYSDLTARCDQLRKQITAFEGGAEECPLDWLVELADICAKLRTKNAGPPRTAAKAAKAAKNDIFGGLEI